MRRRLIILLVTTIVICISAVANANNAAFVYDDFQCWAAAELTGLTCDLYTEDTHSLRTSSGNISMICEFVVPPDCIPQKAVRIKDQPCSTPFGSTNDELFAADSDGYALLRCQIKDQQ